MFHREKVLAALESTSDRFAGYETARQDTLAGYGDSLDALAALSAAEIADRFGDLPWPGARPTAEHDRHPQLVIPFGETWTNHQQARDWARQVLSGVPTIAVDGSQIAPSTEISVPVGAVQIGWFVNPHHREQGYVKNIHFEIVPPDELIEEDQDELEFSARNVNARRFVLECQKLIELIESYRTAPTKPVCFFDGSLIVSFVQQIAPPLQREYLQAVVELIDASAACRVPLVGYIDTSMARDLVRMLDLLTGLPAAQRISDGALLRGRMGWGDRTTAWICARADQVPPEEKAYYERVCFVYLKTTAGRAPVRLDLPRWLLESGQLERTLDVVRAECVVGNGYPYAVETADAVAVITMQDRERFYRAFQAFAEQEGLPLHFSRKATSKLGRR